MQPEPLEPIRNNDYSSMFLLRASFHYMYNVLVSAGLVYACTKLYSGIRRVKNSMTQGLSPQLLSEEEPRPTGIPQGDERDGVSSAAIAHALQRKGSINDFPQPSRPEVSLNTQRPQSPVIAQILHIEDFQTFATPTPEGRRNPHRGIDGVVSPSFHVDPQSPDQQWISSGTQDVVYNNPLFEAGVVLYTPSNAPREKLHQIVDLTNGQFTLGSRHFKFIDRDLAGTFQAKLQSFRLASVTSTQGKRRVIANSERREEVFYPTYVPRGKDQRKPSERDIGLYTLMWSSDPSCKPDGFQFNGFSRFVTAMCMFGSNLQGETNTEVVRPLIKHDNKYSPNEKIIGIDVSSERNPYEVLCFKEFENYCHMVKLYSKDAGRKSIVCHVPGIDYIFFGLELFLKDRITEEALGQYMKHILSKQEQYHRQIQEICKIHDIDVEILSPLDNLFVEPKDWKSLSDADLANSVLGQFELKGKSSSKECEQQINESDFVQSCLSKLRDNNINKAHQASWKLFVATQQERDQQHLNKLSQELISLENEHRRLSQEEKILFGSVRALKTRCGLPEGSDAVTTLQLKKDLKVKEKEQKTKLAEVKLKEAEKLSKKEAYEAFSKKYELRIAPDAQERLNEEIAQLEIDKAEMQSIVQVHTSGNNTLESIELKLREKKEEFRFIKNHKVLKPLANEKPLSTIEALFQLSNAFVLAYAAHGYQDNEVCSLLPLSEKQVQIEYQAHKRSSGIPTPHLFNITAMDAMTGPISAANSTGLLFYNQKNLTSLSQFIDDHHMLRKARTNIGFFAMFPPQEASKKALSLTAARSSNMCDVRVIN